MKIRIKFRKYGIMKFIGHLDLMRYFQKAMRRADIDICYSSGFSPHMIMSFASPLGVGLTSDGEYLDIEIGNELSSASAVQRLNSVMAEGVEVLSFRRIPEEKASNAMALVAAADYEIRFRDASILPEDLASAWESFCGQDTISVIKKTKKGERELDLKPLIYEGTCKKELLDGMPGTLMMRALGDIAYRYAFISAPILKLEVGADAIFSFLLERFVAAAIRYDSDEPMTAVQEKLMSLISENYRAIYHVYAKGKDETERLYLRLLLVTDEICGMTDSYAKEMYQELGGIK